jgi:CHAD domain-containing protein
MFTVARDVPMTALLGRLARRRRWEADSPVRGRRDWLDTFDWRLHGAGMCLEQVSAGGRLSLRLHGGGPLPVELTVPGTPRLADDLPQGVLRRRLAPVIEMRALGAQVGATGTLEVGRLLDGRGKTVVRLELWRPPRRGNALLRVLAVRGFETQARRAAAALADTPGLGALEQDPLEVAAAQLVVPPGGYPSWKLGGLDPGARADDTVQALLAHYARVMALNVDGMRDGVDSEFLHDFRVGLRRSRALLRRVPGLFSEGLIAPHRDDLAWLGRVTGPPRDADVHRLVFPEYHRALDPIHVESLEPLMRRVARAQAQAHRELVAALDSTRFRRRWPAWRRFLARPAPRGSRQPAGPRPAAEVAAAALLRAHRKVRRQGRRITAESPPEAYHELRKSCKNIRYLIDAFGSFWSTKDFKKAAQRLKALQDVLGEHQDLDVHRHAMLAMHRDMVADADMREETHEAMTAIVRELERRAVSARARFGERFERFKAVSLERALRGSGG